MKLNYTKIIVILAVCGIAFCGVYIYSNHHIKNNLLETTIINNSIPANKIVATTSSEKNNYVLPDIFQGKGITDVFQGKFYSQLKDPESTKEPGQRFVVDVTGKKIGNAQGIVIINDSTNKLDLSFSQKGIVHVYRFYTKYDVKNNWYNLVNAELQYSSMFGGGDQ